MSGRVHDYVNRLLRDCDLTRRRQRQFASPAPGTAPAAGLQAISRARAGGGSRCEGILRASPFDLRNRAFGSFARCSSILDLWIVLKTVFTVLNDRNAY
jgi:hypothetical protein